MIFRYILVLLVSIFAISLLRSVIGLIMKAFGEMVGPHLAKAAPTSAGKPQPSPPAPPTGELKKDPVCGTYVPAATAISKRSGGQTLYFCSTNCRDKYSG